jgi:hypothetical protein
MTTALTTVQQKAKSFWDTKEGTTGMVVGMGMLGLIGWGAYKIMPYIANLMENTFYAVLFGLLTVGLVYVTVIDGTLRNRLWMGYKLLMRALTYSIISYDPIGVLREIQKKAKERINLVDENRRKVNGQKMQIENTINSFNNDIKSLKSRVEARRARGELAEAQNDLSKLGRLGDAVQRLTIAFTRTEGFYTQLTRAHKALETIHENIDFEISIVEREYKATTAAHAAWKAVRDAFKGGSEFDELGQQTWAFLAEDYGNKLGEIDSFMTDSMKFIDNVDLTNEAHAQEGLKMLEDLNSRDLLNIVQPTAKPAITQQQSFVTMAPSMNAKTVDYASLRK